MDFFNFCKFILKYQGINKFPEKYEYPSEIILSSSLWEKIISLKRFTDQFNYEHSITVFNIDDDIIITNPVKGTKSSVSSSVKIEVKYNPKNNKYIEKQVFVNGVLSSKSSIKNTQVKKDINITPVFSIHSHPQINGKYSFFSITDINSLNDSKFLCSGLMTDEFLLACKLSSSLIVKKDFQEILNELNKSYLNKDVPNISLLDNLKLAFYRARLKDKLIKVT